MALPLRTSLRWVLQGLVHVILFPGAENETCKISDMVHKILIVKDLGSVG